MNKLLSLSPTSWGKLTLKNRIVMAPMCMYSADLHGHIQPFHESHYSARAYGGVSMVIVEATAVESRGRISHHDLGIYHDAHIEGLRKVVDRVHLAGSLIAIQLAHAGRKSGINDEASIAPSSLTFSQDYRTPQTMDIPMIQAVINAFQAGAKRAQSAGFDGVEIHGAHGYLINQFLSPLSNQRDDAYGGNLQKRTRLLMEILQAVRQVFHGEVWVRLSADEYAEGGHHIHETLAVANLIKPWSAGVNVSSGGVVPFPIQPKPGYQLTYAKQLQQAGILTIGGGLIQDEIAIEEALHQGIQLIYLGRPLLLNPYFVLQLMKQHAPEHMLKAYQRG